MIEEIEQKSPFVDSKGFDYQIEIYMRENKCQGYIDAIVKYCDENSLDVESVASMVTATLKEKIQYEASDYGVMIKGLHQPLMHFE